MIQNVESDLVFREENPKHNLIHKQTEKIKYQTVPL